MTSVGKPPLEGIRVVDFSRIIAGPLCTQQLADMGAEVIKIENPETGDDTRRLVDPGQSHFFLAFNRNKYSVALDIRQPAGQALIHAMLDKTDVVVENFRVGVMHRFGLDYASLQARYPQRIYVSISAYGQHGPMSDRPGFDPVLQAESGMMSLNGEPDGAPMRHLPAGPVRSLRESLESEEVAAREMVTTIALPGGEQLRLLGSPLKFSHTPIRDFAPPPTLGEHTDATLHRLAGCTDKTLAELRAAGTIR